MHVAEILRHLRFAVTAAALLLAPWSSVAQEGVRPPLRILVGFTPGGTTDLAARVLADRLSTSLGRRVIVDNRPGASGRIAATALKHAAADGATVMLAPMVVTVLAPMVWARVEYDPASDFAPVAQVAQYAIALAVNVDVPARDLAQFVAWGKAHPDRASYGVTAAGSLPHLFGVIVGHATGMPWIAIPYRGLAPMEADLAGGHVPAAVDALSNLAALHRERRVRILATSGTRRSTLLPEVKTFREQGFAQLEGTGWIAMYAPARTPTAVIAELSAAVATALRTPDVREQLIRMGYEPMVASPDELRDLAALEAQRWGPLIKAVGFTAD